ncbi:hypothetical protein TB1_027070 [Malus domestica]
MWKKIRHTNERSWRVVVVGFPQGMNQEIEFKCSAFSWNCWNSNVLDRVPGMRERPIGDMVAGLKQLGADADCFLGTNCPHVRVIGKGGLPGERVKLSGSVSSVYWTSLLMASPLALGDIEIDIVNKYTRSPGNAFVEGDASSASYFLAGAAVIRGTVTVEGCAGATVEEGSDYCMIIPPEKLNAT